jgi:hypothetical protein
MEVRAFAEQVLFSESLDEKLKPASGEFTDESPGESMDVREPARSDDLKFAPRRMAASMPKPGAFKDVVRRATAHHIFANHELQALEVMARVALLFPAPSTSKAPQHPPLSPSLALLLL